MDARTVPALDGRPLAFNLSWLERWRGNFKSAGELADVAFQSMSKQSDPEGWAELLVVKAVCAYSLGDHKLADEFLKDGFETLGPHAESGAGIEVLTILATLRQYSENYDEALTHLRDALQIAEDAGLYFEPGRVLHNLCRVNCLAGNIDAALDAGRQSVEQNRSRRNAIMLPYAEEVYAGALVASGDYEEARAEAEKGLTAAVFSDDPRVTCQLHFAIGSSYLKEKRPADALKVFEQGLREATAFDYHLWIRNFHLHLSQTHEAMGTYQQALAHLKVYAEMQATQFKVEAHRQSYELRSQLEYQLARRSAEYERELRDQSVRLNTELVQANETLQMLNRRIEHNALHDALTGIGNRRMMTQYFGRAEQSDNSAKEIAALLIDLDGFKSINDRFGHATGDEVIKVISERLRTLLLDQELLVRMGGDEFLVASTVRTDQGELAELAQDILNRINQPIDLPGDQGAVGASIGISVTRIRPNLERSLLQAADEAMYAAKRSGRNQAFMEPFPAKTGS